MKKYKSVFNEEKLSFSQYQEYDPARADAIKGYFLKYTGKDTDIKKMNNFYQKNEKYFWDKNGQTTEISDPEIENLVTKYLKVKKRTNVNDRGGYISD